MTHEEALDAAVDYTAAYAETDGRWSYTTDDGEVYIVSEADMVELGKRLSATPDAIHAAWLDDVHERVEVRS